MEEKLFRLSRYAHHVHDRRPTDCSCFHVWTSCLLWQSPMSKERFPTLRSCRRTVPQTPLFRFSGQSPTSLIFTRYFPTSKWGIVRLGGKPPGAFGLMMRGIDAGTMPHFARGWFPTWQVWTDNSPLRSGELSGSKYEVGNCPAVETWKWNAEGIFGICSLVRRRLVGVGLGLWVDSSKSLARTRARRVVVSHQ